jgi:hypothetical protein
VVHFKEDFFFTIHLSDMAMGFVQDLEYLYIDRVFFFPLLVLLILLCQSVYGKNDNCRGQVALRNNLKVKVPGCKLWDIAQLCTDSSTLTFILTKRQIFS